MNSYMLLGDVYSINLKRQKRWLAPGLTNTKHHFSWWCLQPDRHLELSYKTNSWFKEVQLRNTEWIQNLPFINLCLMLFSHCSEDKYQGLNICTLILSLIFQLSPSSTSLAVWDWITWFKKQFTAFPVLNWFYACITTTCKILLQLLLPKGNFKKFNARFHLHFKEFKETHCLPSACRPPFWMPHAPASPSDRNGLPDRHTADGMGRFILRQSRRLRVCSSHLSLNPSRSPICSMEATDISQLHGRYWKHLESSQRVLKLQNFTSMDDTPAASHPAVPQLDACQTCVTRARFLEEENPPNCSTEMERELRLCLSCLKESWPCSKSVSGQFQSKTICSNERGRLF